MNDNTTAEVINLIARGHATLEQALTALYGHWPPNGLEIPEDIPLHQGRIRINAYPNLAPLGLARSAGSRQIDIRSSEPPANQASTLAHEILHIEQFDHYQRAEDNFGYLAALIKRAGETSYTADFLASELFDRYTETEKINTPAFKAQSPVARGGFDYLKQGIEIQAHIQQCLVEGYSHWEKFPQNYTELYLALQSAGLKIPENIQESLQSSPDYSAALQTFGKPIQSNATIFPNIVSRIAYAEAGLTPEGRQIFWKKTLPSLYSDLIEMYGDIPGRERFSLGENEYPGMRRRARDHLQSQAENNQLIDSLLTPREQDRFWDIHFNYDRDHKAVLSTDLGTMEAEIACVIDDVHETVLSLPPEKYEAANKLIKICLQYDAPAEMVSAVTPCLHPAQWPDVDSNILSSINRATSELRANAAISALYKHHLPEGNEVSPHFDRRNQETVTRLATLLKQTPSVQEDLISNIPEKSLREALSLSIEQTVPESAVASVVTPLSVQKASLQGHRPYMEDVAIAEQNFRPILPEKWLQTTFGKIQDSTRNEIAGSTATIAIGNPESISVAQMGDSLAIAFVWDSEEKKVTPHRLTRAHQVNDPVEQKLLIARGGEIVKDKESSVYRLKGSNGNLAVSRSLGDKDFPSLIREPEINTYPVNSFKKNPDDRVFLMAVTDGAFEGVNCTPGMYANIISYCIKTGNENKIAEHLSTFSLNMGSKDNISVSFGEIKPDAKGMIVSVFDGHAGDSAAKQAAGVLVTEIVQQLKLQREIELPIPKPTANPTVSQEKAPVMEFKPQSGINLPQDVHAAIKSAVQLLYGDPSKPSEANFPKSTPYNAKTWER